MILSSLLIALVATLAQASDHVIYKFSPKTPQNWTRYYSALEETAVGSNGSQRSTLDLFLGNTGDFEPASWRWRYVDESETEAFSLLVQEDLIDERLANIIDTVGANRVVDLNAFRFNSGDPDEDAANLQAVASASRVDDQLCARQLDEMLAQIDQMRAILSTKRQQPQNQTLKLDKQHIYLARVLDSFGRYDSGFLSGRLHSIGAYEQCLSSQLLLSAGATRTRFCWAQLSMNKHLDPTLRERRRTHTELNEKLLSVGICIPESCHSKSFQEHKRTFQRLVDLQFKLPDSIYLEETPELEGLFCLVDEDSDYSRLSLGALAFLIVVSCWTLFVIFATLRRRSYGRRLAALNESVKSRDNVPVEKRAASPGYQSLMGKIKSLKRRHSKWRTVDLVDAWRDFLVQNEPDRSDMRVQLDALNGIKTVASMLIVYGHAYMIGLSYTSNYLSAVASAEISPSKSIILIYMFIVDTFLVITGVLIGFTSSSKMKKRFKSASPAPSEAVEPNEFVGLNNGHNKTDQHMVMVAHSNQVHTRKAETSAALLSARTLRQLGETWLVLAANRYLRLVPIFLLIFWFKKTLYIHLGSGPMWDSGLNQHTLAGACLRETWLTPLSWLSAYLPLNRQCIVPSWSISNDLYVSILFAPPIVYLLATSRKRLAYALIGLLSSVGCVLALGDYLALEPEKLWELKTLRVWGPIQMCNEFSQIYTKPFYHVVCCLVGVVVGCALFEYHENKIKRWPKWLVGPATHLSVGFILLNLFICVFMTTLRSYMGAPGRTLPYQLITTNRILWAVSNAVLFLRATTDWSKSFLVRLSASKLSKSMSKLNYVLLLVHWDVIMYNFGISTSVINYSNWMYFATFAVAYMCSIPIAMLLYVVVENPLEKLSKSLLFG